MHGLWLLLRAGRFASQPGRQHCLGDPLVVRKARQPAEWIAWSRFLASGLRSIMTHAVMSCYDEGAEGGNANGKVVRPILVDRGKKVLSGAGSGDKGDEDGDANASFARGNFC
ncbi:hypothetical protein L1887_36157 [Cichorium endivia]|nr:hypothetical protein L1887_36157 [Cichorium endivia]